MGSASVTGRRALRRTVAGGTVVLASLLGVLGASTLRGAPSHAASRAARGGRTPASRFRIEGEAVAQLHALWSASVSAKREEVACLAGYSMGGAWYLTRIEPLTVRGDSLGASAGASIERCGPPQWMGTVHTHVALRAGEIPYSTFSGADRGVMRLWWRRWGTAGIFCLLYTDRDAHCEADGRLIAGPETRVTY